MRDLFTDYMEFRKETLPFYYRREVMRKKDTDFEFLDNQQLRLWQDETFHEYTRAEEVQKVIEKWNVIGAAGSFPKWRYRLITKEEYDNASNRS